MKIVPVLFEDHNLVRMRPVTWSLPHFEMRCGMFNVRERVGMCMGDVQGILLGRSVLADLNTDPNWAWGSDRAIAGIDEGDRVLFLSARLAPDFSLIHEIWSVARSGLDFVWKDEQGLVAALLNKDQAGALALDWAAWEKENHDRHVWRDPSQGVRAWEPDQLLPGGESAGLQDDGPRWIWDIVGVTGQAIRDDLSHVLAGPSCSRHPFGIFPEAAVGAPDWSLETHWQVLPDCVPGDLLSRLVVEDPSRVFCGESVALAPGTAFNTEDGPIVLDRGVTVMPQCYLEGPLYIGPGSLVKPGSRIHGQSSFGVVNRIAGEIGESTFGDFANKQHEGFIGHAVLGSWINLGAMTTCSDLKNNYGEIRVDLGGGPQGTGCRFVGLMMGDHAKTAIGTLFNTGTTVGFASNIFGTGMPPKHVGNFRWGGQVDDPAYSVDRALSTAEMVMSRRGCRFTEAHEDLFRYLAG